MTEPLVTVSLVTYNGIRWLDACLASLERQTLHDVEVLVLDNASSDGSLEWLREHATSRAWLAVEASPSNIGYAAAHNGNIYRARSEFVLLLNQDIVLDDGFLAAAVEAFADRPRVGAVQGRLRRLLPGGGRADVLDSTGLVMLRSRRVVARGQGQTDSVRWSVPGPVWGADGPAPMYRRAALMDVEEPRSDGGTEVLDEDFFMYKEDVDLAWRLRRRGWSTWYQPTALAWHARTAGVADDVDLMSRIDRYRDIPPWIRKVSWRNQRLTQVKNDSARDIAPDLPWIAGREVGSALLALQQEGGLPLLSREFRSLVTRARAKRQRSNL